MAVNSASAYSVNMRCYWCWNSIHLSSPIGVFKLLVGCQKYCPSSLKRNLIPPDHREIGLLNKRVCDSVCLPLSCTILVFWNQSLSQFERPFSGCTWVSQYQNVSVLVSVGAKGDGGGAIRRAKLQAKCHYKQTNTQFFFTGRMPFLSPNQQCQSTEGKSYLKFWSFAAVFSCVKPNTAAKLQRRRCHREH